MSLRNGASTMFRAPGQCVLLVIYASSVHRLLQAVLLVMPSLLRKSCGQDMTSMANHDTGQEVPARKNNRWAASTNHRRLSVGGHQKEKKGSENRDDTQPLLEAVSTMTDLCRFCTQERKELKRTILDCVEKNIHNDG